MYIYLAIQGFPDTRKGHGLPFVITMNLTFEKPPPHLSYDTALGKKQREVRSYIETSLSCCVNTPLSLSELIQSLGGLVHSCDKVTFHLLCLRR